MAAVGLPMPGGGFLMGFICCLAFLIKQLKESEGQEHGLCLWMPQRGPPTPAGAYWPHGLSGHCSNLPHNTGFPRAKQVLWKFGFCLDMCKHCPRNLLVFVPLCVKSSRELYTC